MPPRIPALQLRRCSIEADSESEQEHVPYTDEDDAAIDVEADEELDAEQQTANVYVRSTPSAAPPPPSITLELRTKNNNCLERNEGASQGSSMQATAVEKSIIHKAHSY